MNDRGFIKAKSKYHRRKDNTKLLMILNFRPVATCLLCLNSLRGLRSIRFMVTWLVTSFTWLRSLLIEEITALIQLS